MIFRELIFWYFDVSKVSGAWNFAFWSFSNTGYFLHHTWPEHSDTPLDAFKPHKHTYSSSICSQTPPPGISGHIRTTADTIRLQQTPNDTNRRPQTPKRPFKDVWRFVLTWNGVCWCLLVSYVVWRCEEGVWGVFQSVSECCLWTCVRFCCVWGCIWVFWPCMVQQMPYIGKAPKGKIPRTWHFWNIKIPKPPSLKIIGL